LNTLGGNPSEMRFAVVNELHGVNPVQLGREGGGRKSEDRCQRSEDEVRGMMNDERNQEKSQD